jgi:cell division protease FtsH
LATFEEPRTSAFLNISKPQGVREYSERTAQAIDEEIRKLLDDAHARVEQTLAARRGELDALGKLLLEKEVVDREALTQLLAPQKS